MSRFLRLALLAAATVTSSATPALAQTAADEQRFRVAQQRYDRETQIYRQEQARYDAARQRSGRGGYGQGYGGGSGYNGSGYGQGYRTDPGYAPNDYPPQGSYAPQAGYGSPGGYAPQGGYGDRDENGYDPSRDYRSGNYQERTLSTDERVYAGNDGRYYCKRSDGTTGLVIGGAAGGILGNVIDGGHSRIVGTLLGGAAGALAGRAVDKSNSQVRCQ